MIDDAHQWRDGAEEAFQLPVAMTVLIPQPGILPGTGIFCDIGCEKHYR